MPVAKGFTGGSKTGYDYSKKLALERNATTN